MTTQTSSDVLSRVPTYPRIIIQPDWSTHLKSGASSADVWLEFKAGSASVSRITQNIHGVCSIKGLADEDAKAYKTSCSDNFQPADIDRKQRQLRITMRDTNVTHTFQGATKSFSTNGKHGDDRTNPALDALDEVPELKKNPKPQTSASGYPHWFDISSGGMGLTALSNGNITIWDINTGEVRRQLKGHLEDVYTSRFFPSDFAVVSGGADMRVKIWSLDTDSNHIQDATLIGHRSRINDVHALDQQRVLSASNDGSLILWDITKSQQITKLAQLEQVSINSISLIDASSLACACSDGSIRVYDLNNGQPNKVIVELKVGVPLNAVCSLPETKQLVYGSEHAIFGIHDQRQWSDTPVYAWKEQRGKVTCIVPSRDHRGILVTTTDGSCFEYNQDELKALSDATQLHVCDYTGADDSVLNAKIFQNTVYSICHDGLVRVYENSV